MDLRKLSKIADAIHNTTVKINSLDDFRANREEVETDEGYEFLFPKNPDPEWLLADIEDYISDLDEANFEIKVKESHEPEYDLVRIIFQDEDYMDEDDQDDSVKGEDTQVPTKQELIEHFSKLAEDAKENPHWERGYQNYMLDNIKVGKLGEWTTKLKITKYTNAEESDKYAVTLFATQPGINANAYQHDTLRKKLERNWESILEKLIEELITLINIQLKRR